MKNFYQLNTTRVGLLLMLLHCMCMSVSTVLLKLLQSQCHIAQIMFIYNFIICISLSMVCLFGQSQLFQISCDNIKYHFLRSIFGFSGFFLFVYAISSMNIAEARAIIAIDPIITSLLAIFFFKESITTDKIIAAIITFIGAIILLHPSNITISVASISAFFAAICFGIFNNITKRITTGKTFEQMFFLSLFSSIYSFIPAMYNWNNSIWSKNNIIIIIFIAFGFIMSSISAFNAFKRTELSLLMPIHFIGMILTCIMGYMIFNEIPRYLTILGSCIIVIGTIPIFIRK